MDLPNDKSSLILTLFCSLMNFIQPNSVPGVIEAGTDHKTKRVNIVHFLRAAQAYGVPRNRLFEPEDLLYLRHVPKVTRCLYALGKAVSSSKSSWSIQRWS